MGYCRAATASLAPATTWGPRPRGTWGPCPRGAAYTCGAGLEKPLVAFSALRKGTAAPPLLPVRWEERRRNSEDGGIKGWGWMDSGLVSIPISPTEDSDFS